MIKMLQVFVFVSVAMVLSSLTVFIFHPEASGMRRTNTDLDAALSAEYQEIKGHGALVHTSAEERPEQSDRFSNKDALQELRDLAKKQQEEKKQLAASVAKDLRRMKKATEEQERELTDLEVTLQTARKLTEKQSNVTKALKELRTKMNRNATLSDQYLEEWLYYSGLQRALEAQRTVFETRFWRSDDPAADQKKQVLLIIHLLTKLEEFPLNNRSLVVPSVATEGILSELLRHTERLFAAKLAIRAEKLLPLLKAFNRFTASRLRDLNLLSAVGVPAVVATLRTWSTDLDVFGDSFAKFKASDSNDRLTNILALLRSLDKHKQRHVALLMVHNVYTRNVKFLKLFVQLLGLHQEVRADLLRKSMAAQIRMHPEWSRGQCEWRFEKYIPSAWEQEWQLNQESGLWQNKECDMLGFMGKNTVGMVRRNQELMRTPGYPNDPAPHDHDIDHIYSHMVYVEECGADVHKRVHQLIEPLIGINRDPLTFCRPSPAVRVMSKDLKFDKYESPNQSKRFILGQPAAPWAEVSLPDAAANVRTRAHADSDLNIPGSAWRLGGVQPWAGQSRSGRFILIDMGASMYTVWGSDNSACGAVWVVDRWGRFNITFDSIISFEYKKNDPNAVYAAVPKNILPHYTYYNQGVEADPEGKFNVWRILRAISHRDDYVVVKLDIDNPKIENAIFDQLRSAPDLVDLVDECFYEHHVDSKSMWGSWRRVPNLVMRDTYTNFRQLRMLGIRQHSWP